MEDASQMSLQQKTSLRYQGDDESLNRISEKRPWLSFFQHAVKLMLDELDRRFWNQSLNTFAPRERLLIHASNGKVHEETDLCVIPRCLNREKFLRQLHQLHMT